MPLLVRKIERSKWNQNKIHDGEDFSADAITNELKTSQNTLSTWEIDEFEKIEEAALAIVSEGTSIDAMDFAYIDPAIIQKNGLALNQTVGSTPYINYRNKHFDVVELSYTTLKTMAEIISECLKEEKIKRYTKGELKKILKRAIS